MVVGEQEGNAFPEDRDPPRPIFIGESSTRAYGGSGEGKEEKGFDSEGFSEDVEFGRDEKNALAERIEELEKELYDYQYHMGLLLIEKKMRTSEFEELREGLSEARVNLKLERASFYSSLSQKQEQEQSILIALEVEKQNVADLEKTIYKMLTEENNLTEQREILQTWERSLREHELELKGSQNFLGERKMNITNEKEAFGEIQGEVEENQNSFVRLNKAASYSEDDISDRQQNLASKEKEAESKQEKLEGKWRDLLATQVKLPTRESALKSEKQVFDSELESGRESLDGKFKNKLNKLGKQNAVGVECTSQTIDDLLAHKKEVEADKVRVQKDKETLNTLYSRLQKFKQELMKKRDLLLSLSEHCRACMNCNIIFSELDLGGLEIFEGAELEGDILLLSIPNEHLEKKRMEAQNDDSSSQSKGYQSVKIGGCMTSHQQWSELCNPAADGSEKNATDVDIRSRPMLVSCHDNQHNKRLEPGNGAGKFEIIERFLKDVHSSKQYSEIANNALEIECLPNASSINEQNESHASSSKDKKGSDKRPGSLMAVIENSKETLDNIPEEIKQLRKCGSEDLKHANQESKLNLLNAHKMRGSAEQRELHCHASGTTTFEIDPYERKTQPANEGHRKRQRTSDFGLSFPGQKRYHFRPSTILKGLISNLQSEHVVLGRDNEETDIDYEPSNSY